MGARAGMSLCYANSEKLDHSTSKSPRRPGPRSGAASPKARVNALSPRSSYYNPKLPRG